MNGRRLACPRGRVLGVVRHQVNGMVYVRGNAQDYNRWADMGAKGWGYESVLLPYFKKAQCADEGRNADDYRGGEGPWVLRRVAWKIRCTERFLRATEQAGYPHTDDLNGAQQEGFGPMPMTVAQGRRSSTSRSIFAPCSTGLIFGVDPCQRRAHSIERRASVGCGCSGSWSET